MYQKYECITKKKKTSTQVPSRFWIRVDYFNKRAIFLYLDIQPIILISPLQLYPSYRIIQPYSCEKDTFMIEKYNRNGLPTRPLPLVPFLCQLSGWWFSPVSRCQCLLRLFNFRSNLWSDNRAKNNHILEAHVKANNSSYSRISMTPCCRLYRLASNFLHDPNE